MVKGSYLFISNHCTVQRRATRRAEGKGDLLLLQALGKERVSLLSEASCPTISHAAATNMHWEGRYDLPLGFVSGTVIIYGKA